jgi:hypothetical protein
MIISTKKPNPETRMPKRLSIPSNPGLLDSWGRRNRRLLDRVCPNCGVVFRPLRTASKYCSRECSWENNGGRNKKAESWWINSRGYIEGRIWVNGAQKRVKKHRLIMELALGRDLLPEEDVHHIDGNKQNNRRENLELIYHGDHSTRTNLIRWRNSHD